MYTDPKKMAARFSQNLSTPTPESLEVEAADLEARAKEKEKQASFLKADGRNALYTDARIFREEAEAKRAKAERMRKAVTP